MPVGTEWCGGLDDWGGDFDGLSDRSERGVNFHWKRLLRSGCHADDAVSLAKRFLSQTPSHRRPSLVGFLARFESYLEDASLFFAKANTPISDRDCFLSSMWRVSAS
jgi:hypothetical protein